MNKQIKQLIILGGLIVVLAVVFLGNKKKPSKNLTLVSTATNKQISQPNKNIANAGEGSADSKRLALQKQRANAAWGRDPFSTLASKEYQRTDLILKGISFGADGRGFAFINTEIVKPGDKLGDYEIVSIEKDKVLVKKKDSQSFYLTLPKE